MRILLSGILGIAVLFVITLVFFLWEKYKNNKTL